MEAIEELALWNACRELPFAVPRCLLHIEPPPEISEGVTGWIVDTDTDAAHEKATSVIGTGLEGSCGGRGNTLELKEGRGVVEPEASRVWAKWLRVLGVAIPSWLLICVHGLAGDRRSRRLRNEGGKALGSVAVAQVVEMPDKLDDIATGLASRKAVPKVLRDADHKGRRVVTAVDRTGADEPAASLLEMLD
jgi:hypothetical protein